MARSSASISSTESKNRTALLRKSCAPCSSVQRVAIWARFSEPAASFDWVRPCPPPHPYRRLFERVALHRNRNRHSCSSSCQQPNYTAGQDSLTGPSVGPRATTSQSAETPENPRNREALPRPRRVSDYGSGLTARCMQAMPLVRLRYSTSLQPLAAIMRPSSSWAGHARIDSTR